MNIIKLILFSFYSVIIAGIILFNMLYLYKATKAKGIIGLQIPQWVKQVTRASTGLAIFTAILLGTMFLLNIE